MAKTRSSKTLLKWHRRLGITSALFVLMLSITGILLNHSNLLGLDRSHLSAFSAETFYGIEREIIYSEELNFASGTSEAVIVGASVYRTNKLIKACEGDYVGVVAFDDRWALACTDALSLLTFDDEIIDVFDARFDFSASLSAIASCEDSICVLAGEQIWKLEPEYLQFVAHDIEPSWRSKTQASRKLQAQYASHSAEITWERLIQDIHAGRFLGPLGPWLMDLIAIIFIILACTGLMIWVKKDLKSRRKRKPSFQSK